jgi:hypothetical protein
MIAKDQHLKITDLKLRQSEEIKEYYLKPNSEIRSTIVSDVTDKRIRKPDSLRSKDFHPNVP